MIPRRWKTASASSKNRTAPASRAALNTCSMFFSVSPTHMFWSFAVVVRLIDLDACVEETDDPTDVIPGHMPARFTDAAALRALHDPLVAILFPRPDSSAERRARWCPSAGEKPRHPI